MTNKRPTVVKVWRCTIQEAWDDQPAYSVFAPPDTDAEEIERFLVENEHEEKPEIISSFWLDERDEDPESVDPGDEYLILERDSEGKLREKEE